MNETNDFYCDFVLNHKISVEIESETEDILAFRHTKPSYEFHIVIVPKQHIGNLSEVSDFALLSDIFRVIQTLIKKYELEKTDYRIITNGGTNQDSKHLHFHLVNGKKLS